MRQGRFRISSALVCLALAGVVFSTAHAGPPGRWQRSGDRGIQASTVSRRQAREASVPIPWDQLTPEASRRIRDVVQSPTLSRTLQPQVISSDPNLFVFLVRHPEVIVGIWDVMGISKVQTRRTGPYTIQGSDGAGTTCSIELVYGTPTLHVFLATGEYRGPLLTGPITGRCVIALESGYTQGAGDESLVTGKMHVYMQLDGIGIDLAARTLQGLIWQTTEQNFSETGKFVGQIQSVSAHNPMGMRDLADRLPNVDPPVRNELTRIAFAVAEGAAPGRKLATEAATEAQSVAAALKSPVRPEKGPPRLRR